MPERIIKYTEALKEAAESAMAEDSRVFVIGLGVSYPKGADGTTAGLKEKFPDRVLDTPVSEAAVTGMSVGAAISGLRPIVHHGRVEFSLLASDAIVTQAAKWNYMFGGGNPVPIVFRIALGRQWGNGPQHTQALYGLFGSVPGLKVVVPATPRMAKGLLISAIADPNPVVMLEPRWLYNVKENVSAESFAVPLDRARVTRLGTEVTIVAYGDGYLAAHEACEALASEGIEAELIDLVSINPIDYESVFASVAKTGRLLCVDTTSGAFGIGSEVISKVAQQDFLALRCAPASLSTPSVPCPTSTALTAHYYPTKVDIGNAVRNMLGKAAIEQELSFEELHLAPTCTIAESVAPAVTSPGLYAPPLQA